MTLQISSRVIWAIDNNLAEKSVYEGEMTTIWKVWKKWSLYQTLMIETMDILLFPWQNKDYKKKIGKIYRSYDRRPLRRWSKNQKME